MLPVAFANELNLVYDANGNLISGDGFIREYNSLNQLVYIRNESSNMILQELVHDPLEERILIKKEFDNSGTLLETTYYFSKNYVRVVNASGTFNFTYVYHEGHLIGQVNPDGSKHFIHTDHLGSVTKATNANRAVIESPSYTPFGKTSTSGGTTRYGYEGKEFEPRTGQTDFHFRSYQPDTAQFTQPDTLLTDIYDPQQLNRYAFERNNPYNTIDPTGHFGLGFRRLFDRAKKAFNNVKRTTQSELQKVKESVSQSARTVADFFGYTEVNAIATYADAELSLQTQGSASGYSRRSVNQLGRDAAGAAGILALDGFSGRLGGKAFKVARKTLLESGSVTVKSFGDANFLRREVFPDAVKIPGSGSNKRISSRQMNKLNQKHGTYHTDFTLDSQAGEINRHPGPNPHGQLPHINIQSKTGKKYTITIDADGTK